MTLLQRFGLLVLLIIAFVMLVNLGQKEETVIISFVGMMVLYCVMLVLSIRGEYKP